MYTINPRNTRPLASLGNETPSLGSETRDTEKWALREKNCGEPQTETRALQVVWRA